MSKYTNKKIRQTMLKNNQSDLQATLMAILSQYFSFDMRKSNKVAKKTKPFLRIKRINRGKDFIDVMNYMRERSSLIKNYLVESEGIKTSVAIHRLEQVKRKEVIHLLEDILIEFGGLVLIEKEETSGISGQTIVLFYLLEQYAFLLQLFPQFYLPLVDYQEFEYLNTNEINDIPFLQPLNNQDQQLSQQEHNLSQNEMMEQQLEIMNDIYLRKENEINNDSSSVRTIFRNDNDYNNENYENMEEEHDYDDKNNSIQDECKQMVIENDDVNAHDDEKEMKEDDDVNEIKIVMDEQINKEENEIQQEMNQNEDISKLDDENNEDNQQQEGQLEEENIQQEDIEEHQEHLNIENANNEHKQDIEPNEIPQPINNQFVPISIIINEMDIKRIGLNVRQYIINKLGNNAEISIGQGELVHFLFCE